MSDQVTYLLMTGLNAAQDRMTATAANLANVHTTAFKAQRPVMEALPFAGRGLPDVSARADVAAIEEAPDFSPGQFRVTGRPLDVAVKGSGFIAVDGGNGTVAYTRDGALEVAPTGVLETVRGNAVLGQSGQPIVLPQLQSVTIGEDGSVSGVLSGQKPRQIVKFDQIMLANPPAANLRRRPDGLFEDTTGAVRIDGSVRLASGALEESNVSSVGAMIGLIENTRMFETETGMLRTLGGLGQGAESPMTLR